MILFVNFELYSVIIFSTPLALLEFTPTSNPGVENMIKQEYSTINQSINILKFN